ncbi:MAG TPA: CHAT domain-containing protein, partial [Pyrinomonadaceae bacterium]|nr:CHAT domain-containing protein [Pyrinomonadaceae bacterium]
RGLARSLSVCALVVLSTLGLTPPGRTGPGWDARAEEGTGDNGTSGASALGPRQSAERDLSPGQSHSYRIALGAGGYARASVECWAVGADLIVYDPSGRKTAESVCPRGGLVLTSIVADAAGDYRLEVRAASKGSAGGGYRVEVEELGRATPADAGRLAAEAAFARAEQMRTERTADSAHEALKKYEEARSFWQSAGRRRDLLRTLKGLAQVYQSLEETEQAHHYFGRALALSRALSLKRDEADLLSASGNLHFNSGDNERSRAAADRAYRVSRAAGYRRGEAQALYVLGHAFYGLGDLQKSGDYYRRSLQLWRELNDWQAQSLVLVSLGYTFIELSEVARALDFCNKAFTLSRAGGDPHLEAVALRALGNLHTKLGENQQALDAFLRALALVEGVEDRRLKATILGGLGFTYDWLGEKRKALDYYGQALDIFKSIKDRWGEAEAELFIGEAHHSLGETETALAHYNAALSLFRALGMPRYQAQTLRDLGLVYDSLGDRARALDCYQQSLALTRPGQDQRYEAYTLNYVGRLHEGAGETRRALRYYERALALNRVAVDHAGEALTLYHVARAWRDLGRLEEARSRVESAIRIAESLRTKVAGHDLRAAYLASAHKYYELYVDILMRLHKERPAEGIDGAAFEASERARARSLLETLGESRADIRRGVDPQLLERERALQRDLSAKAELQMRLGGGPQHADEAAALAREIQQLATRYDEVRAQIKAASPHYAALTQPQPLGLREIQRQVLDDDSLLLAFELGDDRSYLWAVGRDHLASFELPARAEVESAARSFYGLLTASQPQPGETQEQRRERTAEADRQLPSASAALGSMLLGRAAPLLGQRRLLVVPDGALQYIPFQTLVVPELAEHTARSGEEGGDTGQLPLVLTHEIVNEPSASALATLLNETAGRGAAPKTVAVLADPVFQPDDPRIQGASAGGPAGGPNELRQALRGVGFAEDGGRLPRLLASREEAEAIMSVVPRGSGMKATDFEASRATAVGAELGQYRVVHFATHGLLNNEQPELSGIVLSLFDRQGQAQSGFLRLYDIYNLDLPVDLVVLSACNTGLGKEIKGEGLVGLTRGFMYAGAASVVASLWKVDDEATAELMRHFYRGLFERGLSPSSALREAQLAMRQQKRWRSPYYWAGFVIQGRHGELKWPPAGQTRVARGPAAWGIAAATLSFGVWYFVRLRRRRAVVVRGPSRR